MRAPTLLFCFLLVFWTLAASAERWQQPSSAMVDTGRQVVAVEVVSVEEGQRVLFRRVQDLIGESSKQFALRIPAELAEELTVGDHYLVGFSKFRKNPLFRRGFEIDPEGPRVVELVGVGPALFEDVPELRRLISAALASPPVKADERLLDVMALMAKGQPRLLTFAAAELLVDRDLLERADESTATGLREALGRPKLDLETQDFLLKTAVRLPDSLRRDWVVAEDRKLLRDLGPQLDLATLGPSLVVTALEDMERDGEKGDSELISPFLGSNHPGVVRAAIRSLDRLDPDRAEKVAREMSQEVDLHPSSRRSLESYLESRETGALDD